MENIRAGNNQQNTAAQTLGQQSSDGATVIVPRGSDGENASSKTNTTSSSTTPINNFQNTSQAGPSQVFSGIPASSNEPGKPSTSMVVSPPESFAATAAPYSGMYAGPITSDGRLKSPSTCHPGSPFQSMQSPFGPTFSPQMAFGMAQNPFVLNSFGQCAPLQTTCFQSVPYAENGNMCGMQGTWPSMFPSTMQQQSIPTYLSQCADVSNNGMNMNPKQRVAQCTSGGAMQGVTKKRGPGRPPKQKRDNDTDYQPPSGKRSKADDTDEVLVLPPRTKDDVYIPAEKASRCCKCRQWVGRYILDPCFHYGFCVSCLALEHIKAKSLGKPPACMACGMKVSKYRLGFKCTIATLPFDSDSD